MNTHSITMPFAQHSNIRKDEFFPNEAKLQHIGFWSYMWRAYRRYRLLREVYLSEKEFEAGKYSEFTSFSDLEKGM